jgi:hypothetical protein
LFWNVEIPVTFNCSVFVVPATSSFSEGLVELIPTLPPAVIRTLSADALLPLLNLKIKSPKLLAVLFA